MSARITAQGPAVLTSWKEIASYLGKGVRTVQRWESEFGLPVRRPSQNRHIVLASREELDAWIVTWSQRPTQATSGDGSGVSAVSKNFSAQMELARELRATLRRRRSELQHSMNALNDACRALCEQMVNGTPDSDLAPVRRRKG